MTRKDYVMIAEAVKDAGRKAALCRSETADTAKAALLDAATYIADGLAQDNPRFDRKRFMEACGFTA